MDITYCSPTKQNPNPTVLVQATLPLYPNDIAFELPQDDLSYTILEAVSKSGILELFRDYDSSSNGYSACSLLSAILLAYSEEGYASTRHLAKKCKFDLRYRFFFNTMTPSHMVFQRFMKKHLSDELLLELLALINEYIQTKVPVNIDDLYIDGTKIEANANKFTFVWRKQAEKQLTSNFTKFWKTMDSITEYCLNEMISFRFSKVTTPTLENAFKALTKVGELCNTHCPLFVYGRGRHKHPLQRFYDDLQSFFEKMMKYSYYLEKMGSRNSLSKTDLDASFLHMKYDYYCNTGVFKPGYNVQIGVCDGFIWNVYINTDANDIRSYIPFMNNFQALYGYLPKNVCADAGYGSYDNYLYNLDNGIESYIKYPHWEKEQHNSRKDKFKPFRFTFDESGKLFCPAGEELKMVSSRRDYRNERIYPRFTHTYMTHACETCEVRNQCTRSPKGRTIRKTMGLDEIQSHVRENLMSDKGCELRKQRNIQAEGTFGQIKEDYNYDRFRRRGLSNVKKEFLLVAISFNLRKLHTVLSNSFLTGSEDEE